MAELNENYVIQKLKFQTLLSGLRKIVTLKDDGKVLLLVRRRLVGYQWRLVISDSYGDFQLVCGEGWVLSQQGAKTAAMKRLSALSAHYRRS